MTTITPWIQLARENMQYAKETFDSALCELLEGRIVWWYHGKQLRTGRVVEVEDGTLTVETGSGARLKVGNERVVDVGNKEE